MSHQRDGISFCLLTLKSFGDNSLASLLLDTLLNKKSFLKLSKYNTIGEPSTKIVRDDFKPLIDGWFEPIEPETPFSSEGERILCLSGSKNVDVMIVWDDDPNNLNLVSGSFPSEYIKNNELYRSFQCWIMELTQYLNPVYGCIQNMMTKGWATPYDLSIRLPEIPWGTIYGAPYIQMFGEKKIEEAPYHSVEKWESETLFCKLTDNLLDPKLSNDSRQSVREYLGEDAFMRGIREPRHYKNGRSPLNDEK